MKQFKNQSIRLLLIAVIAALSLFLYADEDRQYGSERYAEKSLVGNTNIQSPITVIDLWYGDKQIFGYPGTAQRWINILGNVSCLAGMDRLSFSLNGSAESILAIGPDGRRLVSDGDFNIEIDKGKLNIGINRLAINAVDKNGSRASREVIVEFKENIWPLPYSVNWKSVSGIQEVVQVVDGVWILDGKGIRTHPKHVGYDRVIAIGDMNWKDYEVIIPVTIHRIDESAYRSRISKGPAFGINMHWLGHTDNPEKCFQPHCGWEPTGGSHWYKFRKG
ncbi:MAG: hypothetical protein JRJ39_05585, partial [Deltaproteobacteria bacterium]|nr:hypothetical protein [Deltaproteobacteria bacterium]